LIGRSRDNESATTYAAEVAITAKIASNSMYSLRRASAGVANHRHAAATTNAKLYHRRIVDEQRHHRTLLRRDFVPPRQEMSPRWTALPSVLFSTT